MVAATRSRKILVGVSDSANSAAALRRAAFEAEQGPATIELVHVLRGADAEGSEIEAEQMVRDVLSRSSLSRLGESVSIRIERGEAGPVLARMSTEADVLIVGACSRSEVRGIFSGEIVRYCLTFALCPVQVCADHGPVKSSGR